MFRGGPGGNDPHVSRVGAYLQIRMDQQQELAVLRLAHSDPAFFALAVLFIRNRNHQGIMKHRGSLFETDSLGLQGSIESMSIVRNCAASRVALDVMV